MKFLIHCLLFSLTLTSSQATDDMNEKAFSIRKNQLNAMMNYAKALTPPALQHLTCIDLYFKCEALHDAYNKRREFNEANHIVDPICDTVYNSFLMEKVRDKWAERWGTGGEPALISWILRENELEGLNLSVKLIIADIVESIEIYEKLYGSHPRKNEFS
ncbi:MAG: hypothetical protein K0R76_215 [Alphaproteobacteria bacterium]|jgi:hypothetical protein|nr:hypothetical protein [Alphaproteobacteria bacterium]